MDILFKLKHLYYFVAEACCTWKSEIWDKDLDEQYCCDGVECACGGESVRDMYEYIYKQK